MPHEILFTEMANEELASIRPFNRRRIIDEIESELTHEPEAQTRKKKTLKKEVIAPFKFDPPLRELRMGDNRVFYDVDAGAMRVTVGSVRRKLPNQTTEDVLK